MTTKSLTTKPTITEIPTLLYRTNDYTICKTKSGNRPINKSKIKKLTLKMLRKNMLIDFPIRVALVNKDYYIVDGQHRHEVCRNNGLDIYFMVCQICKTVEDIQSVNSDNSGWNPHDMVAARIKIGDPEYIYLDEFVQQSGLSISVCAALCMGGLTWHESGSESVLSGKFRVLDKAGANQVVSWINDIRPYSIAASWRHRSFIYALVHMYRVEGFKHSVFMKKLKECGKQVQRRANIPDYVRHIQEIYNYKTRAENRKTVSEVTLAKLQRSGKTSK